MRALIICILAVALSGCGPSTPESGLTIIESAHDVEKTVVRLQAGIDAAGLTLMAAVDHTGNAREAGLDLPATRLLIFGKPKVGTELMRAARTIAIDLPQKMLVWQDDEGKTWIGYNDPGWMMARHRADVPAPMVENITGLLNKLASDAAAPTP